MTPAATPDAVGIAIRARRKELGLDQRALATRIGVTRQWVIAVERGKPGAPLGLVMRALQALGLGLFVDEVGKKAATARAESAGPPIPLADLDAIIRRSIRGEPRPLLVHDSGSPEAVVRRYARDPAPGTPRRPRRAR